LTVLAEREPGVTSSDPCPAQNLVADVTPAEAVGSTFVGTYAGDTTTDRDMTVFWSVERVYAGEGITDDLFFTTPRCEWANLTPGVRYLFSTAATNLQPSEEAADRPGVTDSLAWEIRDGGEVRLAPFDTWDVEDYGAPELQAITTLEDALAAVAPDGGEGEEPGQLDADFGCAEAPGTVGLDDVRGTMFVGTYLGHERLPSQAFGNLRVVWSVERVYAGGPLAEVLVLRSDACQSVSLPAGRRYLFSSADIVAPGRPDSVAWRLRDEGRVRLAPLGNEDLESLPETATRASRDTYKADIRAIRTFDEALEALAPGAGEGEPPVRSADRTPG
jgi:hypothetical protein